jgi:hypothetical protein
MPVAIYAISYQDSGAILSFVALEKQSVIDKPSAQALHDRLVGTGLVVSLQTPASQPFKIPASQLFVDEVQNVEQVDLADNPFIYVLAPPANPSATPGDGTPKQVTKIANANVDLTLAHASSKLTAAPHNPSGTKIQMYAILAGHDVASGSQQLPATTAEFDFGGGAITQNAAFPVIFVGQGLSTFVGLLKAT